MNLQDFACKMSDLIWGGELAWDRDGGLEALADRIKQKINQNESIKSKKVKQTEDKDKREEAKREFSRFLRYLSAAITLVGGDVTENKIKNMTVEELYTLVYPNDIKLSFKLTRDVSEYEF